MKIDLHTHTIASGHAFNTGTEMAKAAKEKGVDVFAITDHGPAMPGSAPKSYFQCLDRFPKEIDGVRVLYGVEANIINLNGKLDLENKILEKLDVVMAGLHNDCGYNDLGKEKNTQAIINAMKNPFVKMISHPYSKKKWFDVDIEKIAEASCEHNVLLEVNCSYFYKKNLEEMHENIKRMITILKKNDKKVIINSDAHSVIEIGRDEAVKEKFDYLGLTDDDIINNNKKEVLNFFGVEG